MRTIDFRNTQTNAIETRREQVEGSGNFNVVVPNPPAGRVEGNFGYQLLLRHTLEAPGRVDWAQFGVNKFFSKRYRFSCDWNPNHSLAELRSFGFSAFNSCIRDAERGQWVNEGLYYQTENILHGPLEGVGFYHATIQQYFNQVWGGIPVMNSRYKYLFFNIETSNEWYPGNSGSVYPGYSQGGSYNTAWSRPWDELKGQSILCETDGQTRTVEQVANMGPNFWEGEKNRRRANRLVIAMQVGRLRADPHGVLLGWGGAAVQGIVSQQPGVPAYIFGTTVFNEGQANGEHLGADAQGNINFGPATLKLTGDQYTWETVHLNYDYPMFFQMLESDVNEIWNGNDDSKKTHAYVSGKIVPIHVGGYMKSRWQAIRYRMKNRQGWKVIPQVHMIELYYEGDDLNIVDGNGTYVRYGGHYRAAETHLQGVASHGNNTGGIAYYDTPKVWIAPGDMYTRKVWHRFLCADDDGSGDHIWEARAIFDPNNPNDPSTKVYNHDQHTATALLMARHALQPLELMFEQANTLIEDPEVRLQGESTWMAYNGAQAQAYNGDGTWTTPKPAYSMRIWDLGDRWDVVVVGSHKQPTSTTSRTDTLRVPGGGINGNMVRITLRGHWAKISRFSIPKSASGQTFDDLGQNTLEKPGYAGEIV